MRLPTLSAPRQTGETSKRSITPERMSSMKAIPFQPAELIAVITITPGGQELDVGAAVEAGDLDDALEEGAEEEQPDHRLDQRDRDPGGLAQERAAGCAG